MHVSEGSYPPKVLEQLADVQLHSRPGSRYCLGLITKYNDERRERLAFGAWIINQEQILSCIFSKMTSFISHEKTATSSSER